MPFIEPFNQWPRLSDAQYEALCTRIGLDAADLAAEALSTDLLERLSIAFQTSIPFENTRLHLLDSELDSDEPIEWMRGGMNGEGMPDTFDELFDLVVTQNRGSYCYGICSLAQALLTRLGFVVCPMHTRTNGAYHTSTTVWAYASHVVLFVELEGRSYLFDVAFSAGCSIKPVPLDGEVVGSPSPTESFFVRKEQMPGLEDTDLASRLAPEGWTLYRRFSDRHDGKGPLTAAVYHVSVWAVTPIDIAGFIYVLNGREGMHGRRPHQKRLICNVLLPDGSRRNLVYQTGDTQVRYYVRSGMLGQITEEEYLPATPRAVHKVMRERFGMFR